MCNLCFLSHCRDLTSQIQLPERVFSLSCSFTFYIICVLPHVIYFLQESEELHTDPKVQKARFPSPSSPPWGPQDVPDKHVNLALPWSKFQSSSSNPWGLQESAFPVTEIGFPNNSFQADVTYTPVEAFQPLPPVSLPDCTFLLLATCIWYIITNCIYLLPVCTLHACAPACLAACSHVEVICSQHCSADLCIALYCNAFCPFWPGRTCCVCICDC